MAVVTLIDGKRVAKEPIEKTIPGRNSLDETLNDPTDLPPCKEPYNKLELGAGARYPKEL